jgi:SAM-dependent methyltransferase
MNEWPGELRRVPPLDSTTYAIRAPLAAWLRREADAERARGRPLRVLDVGCGVKPYYPWFSFAAEYVGVDVVDNPAADLHGSVEDLPVPDGSFDLILCIQVLEHCADPARAVRELRRAVAPDGRVLASTHGVQVYHPAPDDHWRWTHTGLERLFTENGDWRAVTVRPACGTTSTLGLLLSIYLELLARRARARWLGRALVGALNRAAPAIDARVPILREPGPGTIHANYHVTAET